MSRIFSVSNYDFNLYAVPNLFTGILMLVLGTIVFLQRKNSIIHFSFFLMCLAVSLWLLGFSLAYLSQEAWLANFWIIHLAYLGVTLIAPGFYFFSVAFTKQLRGREWTVVLNYGLGLMFYLLVKYASCFAFTFKKFFWGWYTLYSYWHATFLFFFFLLLVVTWKNFFIAFRKSASPIEKGQLRSILWGVAIAYLGTSDYLPTIGLSFYPFGYLPVAVFILILFRAMRKYRLFLITPAVAADTIVHTMADSLIVFGLDGNILLVNPVTAGLLGYKRQELIGRPAQDVFWEKEKFREILGTLVEKRSVQNYEIMYLSRTGERIPVSFSVSPVTDKFGTTSGFVGIARDIRTTKKLIEALKEKSRALELELGERKKAETDLQKAYQDLKATQAQLLQSEKMASIGQLAAGVAHEINNPTAFVLSNLEILKKYAERLGKILAKYKEMENCWDTSSPEKEEAARLKEELERLKKEEFEMDYILSDLSKLIEESCDGARRIKRIVSDLRTFSHAEEAAQTKVRLSELLATALNIVKNEIKYKAEIVEECDNSIEITCYPQLLSQALLNLLVNAGQAIKDKGIITIRTYFRDGCVFIEIADTGCGMSQDVTAHLFEPFFTTKPVGQGTGLGLSMVYNIVLKHGGSIDVQSKEGEGTTFIISLPVGISMEN